MLYIIAYDIPNDRRRTKVHKLLCGYGSWTQYSLFECFLNDKQLIMLHHRLDKLLDASEDNLRLYPICQRCQNTTITIGSKQPVEETLYLL